MKILNTTPISDAAQMPIKKGTLKFLQDSYTEAINAILTWISQTQYTDAFDPTVPFCLYGCVNTGTGSSYVVSAGAIFYQGEFYLVPAANFTVVGGGDTAVCGILTTQYTVDADPVTFTDSTPRNVHNIRTVVITEGASGSAAFDFASIVRITRQIAPRVNLTAGSNVTINGSYPNLEIEAAPPVPSPVLLKGTYAAGDIPTPAIAVTISLGVTLADANYMVFGTIVSKSTDVTRDDVQFSIRNRTTTSFDVVFHEADNVTQNVDFDWFIIHK